MTPRSERPLCLLDAATFSLAPGITWDGVALRNQAGNSTYPVNPTGRYVLDRQDGTLSMMTLAHEIARRFGIPPSMASRDLHEFVFDLHAHQLVSIRQPYTSELLARTRNLVRGTRDRILFGSSVQFTYPNRRYPVTAWWVVVGGLEAHLPTVGYGVAGAFAAALIVALPGALRNNPPPPTLPALASLLVLAYVVVLIASGWLHELVHCWVARRLGLRLTSVFVRMHVFGVAHQSDDPVKSAYVSVAGPAVTTVVLAGLALLLWNMPVLLPTARMELALLLLAVALQHLPGLTPLTTDGRLAARAVALLARSRMTGR